MHYDAPIALSRAAKLLSQAGCEISYDKLRRTVLSNRIPSDILTHVNGKPRIRSSALYTRLPQALGFEPLTSDSPKGWLQDHEIDMALEAEHHRMIEDVPSAFPIEQHNQAIADLHRIHEKALVRVRDHLRVPEFSSEGSAKTLRAERFSGHAYGWPVHIINALYREARLYAVTELLATETPDFPVRLIEAETEFNTQAMRIRSAMERLSLNIMFDRVSCHADGLHTRHFARQAAPRKPAPQTKPQQEMGAAA